MMAKTLIFVHELPILCQVQGAFSFTSSYGGGTVYGVSGSTVTFTWIFSGDTGTANWGIKKNNENEVIILVSVDQTGRVSFSPPAPGAYVKRVNGTFNGDSSGGQAIFTLANITKDDENIFGCKAESSDFIVQLFDAVALVIVAPPSITHISANQTVNDGDVMTLNCTAVGFPTPNITWTRVSDNRVVMMPFTISTQGGGIYRCTATNNIGHPARADVFVTVQYAATIESVSSSVSKSWIGQTVRLTCMSDGVPTPTLSWYNPKGTKFNSVQRKENTVDVAMNSDQDFGLYNCTADNDLLLHLKRYVYTK